MFLDMVFGRGLNTPHLHTASKSMISEHSRPSEQRVISGVTILAFGEQSIKYDQNYSQQRVVPLMGLDTILAVLIINNLRLGCFFLTLVIYWV